MSWGEDHFSASEPADRTDAVRLLVAVIAQQQEGAPSWRRVGALLHQRRERFAAHAPADERLIPLRFTVRDGWSSPELRAAISDACAVQALVLHPGGLLQLGPHADAYLEAVDVDAGSTPSRLRPRRLLSVPDPTPDPMP